MLKLDFERQYKNISVNGLEIEVYDSIPTVERSAILSAALSAANQFGSLNRMFYNAALCAMICIKYTNLDINMEDSILDIYDYLSYTGVADAVFAAIKEMRKGELESLLDYAAKYYAEVFETANAAGFALEKVGSELLSTIIGLLPKGGKQELIEAKEAKELN
jgi:hypothetical protein|nr:MAG TPA: hypothetical protein [Caudoviricetes sp.]